MKGFHDGFDDALIGGSAAAFGVIAGNFIDSKVSGNLKYLPLGIGGASFVGGILFHKHTFISSLLLGFGIGLIISGLGAVLPQLSPYV